MRVPCVRVRGCEHGAVCRDAARQWDAGGVKQPQAGQWEQGAVLPWLLALKPWDERQQLPCLDVGRGHLPKVTPSIPPEQAVSLQRFPPGWISLAGGAVGSDRRPTWWVSPREKHPAPHVPLLQLAPSPVGKQELGFASAPEPARQQ